MSLKIIRFNPTFGRIAIVVAALVACLASWSFIKWNFANVVASTLDTRLPEARIIAEWVTGLAPSDPQTHLTTAITLDKSFDQADLERAIREYEIAVSLGPNNYVPLLELARVRSSIGDTEGAFAAYERAFALAPNYAAVHWAYGNALIRDGQTERGFELAGRAAAVNPEYARAAASTALHVFDGDVAAVNQALSNSPVTLAAIATVLAARDRYEDAVAVWEKLDPTSRAAQDSARILEDKLAVAKRYRLAARVMSKTAADQSIKPSAGQIANGGFENGVKVRDAGLFEWRIAEGSQPQIGLSQTATHGGQNSLLIAFNSFEAAAFRSVSQIIAVEPSSRYELSFFYKSDIKSKVFFKFEVAATETGAVIASSQPLTLEPNWTEARFAFATPAAGDGIIVRLAREGCAGAACPVNGRLSVDDFSLQSVPTK